jgi:hypothetical protein
VSRTIVQSYRTTSCTESRVFCTRASIGIGLPPSILDRDTASYVRIIPHTVPKYICTSTDGRFLYHRKLTVRAHENEFHISEIRGTRFKVSEQEHRIRPLYRISDCEQYG